MEENINIDEDEENQHNSLIFEKTKKVNLTQTDEKDKNLKKKSTKKII